MARPITEPISAIAAVIAGGPITMPVRVPGRPSFESAEHLDDAPLGEGPTEIDHQFADSTAAGELLAEFGEAEIAHE